MFLQYQFTSLQHEDYAESFEGVYTVHLELPLFKLLMVTPFLHQHVIQLIVKTNNIKIIIKYGLMQVTYTSNRIVILYPCRHICNVHILFYIKQYRCILSTIIIRWLSVCNLYVTVNQRWGLTTCTCKSIYVNSFIHNGVVKNTTHIYLNYV